MRENTSTRINVPKCNLLPTPFVPPASATGAHKYYLWKYTAPLAESVYTYEPSGAAHTFHTLALSLSFASFFSSIQILKYPSRVIQSYVLCCISAAPLSAFIMCIFIIIPWTGSNMPRWREAPLLFLQIYDSWWWTVVLQLLVIDTQFIIISSAAISALEYCFFNSGRKAHLADMSFKMTAWRAGNWFSRVCVAKKLIFPLLP